MTVAYPEFRAERCTRFRYRYSECRRCLDACPHEAIALDESGARLDTARCQNCALCMSACLTGAWAGASFQPIELLRQAIRQPALSLACAPSGQVADAVVPCLGAVDGAMLAYLAKRRIPVTLKGGAHCGECAHGAKGRAQLEANLDAADKLRIAGDGDAWVAAVLQDDAPAADAGRPERTFAADRRQIFRRLVGRGIDEAARAAEPIAAQRSVPEKGIRAGPYARTERREILQIVCERKDGKPFVMSWHEGLPLLLLRLAPGCTVCEACFRVCPTGAIGIVENPGDWALTFQADHCVACAVCLEVCQPRVLDAEAGFDARPEQPARVLHSMIKQRCARCDRFFVSPVPEDTCPVCRDDEDAFARIYGNA